MKEFGNGTDTSATEATAQNGDVVFSEIDRELQQKIKKVAK
jgi:hypothetical protein